MTAPELHDSSPGRCEHGTPYNVYCPPCGPRDIPEKVNDPFFTGERGGHERTTITVVSEQGPEALARLLKVLNSLPGIVSVVVTPAGEAEETDDANLAEHSARQRETDWPKVAQLMLDAQNGDPVAQAVVRRRAALIDPEDI